MIKKTITYTDYNGDEHTEDYYFNLSKSELIELQASIEGGLDNFLEKIGAELDAKEMFAFLKKLILTSYGEKSLDGKRFIKSEEMSTGFYQSEAYSELFMGLINKEDDGKSLQEFISGIVPTELSSAM